MCIKSGGNGVSMKTQVGELRDSERPRNLLYGICWLIAAGFDELASMGAQFSMVMIRLGRRSELPDSWIS